MPPVNMYDQHGNTVVVQEQDVGAAIAGGLHPESPEEQALRVGATTRQEQFGGLGNTILAGGLGVARTATFGLSDVAARAAGGADAVDALREVHPTASTGGEIAGAFLPGGLGKLASGVGKAIRGGEEVGALAGLGRSALAGAAEGGLYGAGAGVSELALSDDPLTLEHVASTLSSNALYGAGAGGAIGLGGRAAEIGLQKAKGALDDFVVARQTARAISDDPAAIAAADVTTLDTKGLNKAEAAELQRIEGERMPERKQVLDDVAKLRDQMHGADMLSAVHGVEDGEVREFGGSLKRADRDLRNALDNKAALAKDPARVLRTLQQQEQALTDITTWGRDALDELDLSEQRLESVRERIRAGKHPDYLPEHLTDRGVDFAAEREMRKAGLKLPGDLPEYDKLQHIVVNFPGAIDANRDLQRRLTDLMAAPTSPRLTAIADAHDALGAARQPTLGSIALRTAARLAGPVGALAEHGAGALSTLKRAAGAAVERSAKATSAFLGGASKVAAEAPLATKVLGSLRYGAGAAKATEGQTLPELFRARADEVKEQVHFAADGSLQMRPAAREAMASRLAGLGAVDPIAADRLETAGARRITWLAAQLPRRPDIAGMQTGPDRWQPSDMEMRSWARKAAAADDPHGVLERVAHGSVTPEDTMAMRAVYPEIMNQFINEVSAQLPMLRQALPYQRQLALSMFTGVPVDPALDPKILKVLQGHFSGEVGTAGGTQAPKAQPAFGSLKKSPDQPTSAQVRAQGAHV